MMHGRRNRSGRPGGCQTNNLTRKNSYVHIISSFVNSGVARILLQGSRTRGARVPKFVVTKSSRSESHLALGLRKRILLKFFCNSLPQ